MFYFFPTMKEGRLCAYVYLLGVPLSLNGLSYLYVSGVNRFRLSHECDTEYTKIKNKTK